MAEHENHRHCPACGYVLKLEETNDDATRYFWCGHCHELVGTTVRSYVMETGAWSLDHHGITDGVNEFA